MAAATLESFGDAIAGMSPLNRIGRPDDMAGVVVYLTSRAGSYVTGAVLPVDGGSATAAWREICTIPSLPRPERASVQIASRERGPTSRPPVPGATPPAPPG